MGARRASLDPFAARGSLGNDSLITNSIAQQPLLALLLVCCCACFLAFYNSPTTSPCPRGSARLLVYRGSRALPGLSPFIYANRAHCKDLSVLRQAPLIAIQARRASHRQGEGRLQTPNTEWTVRGSESPCPGRTQTHCTYARSPVRRGARAVCPDLQGRPAEPPWAAQWIPGTWSSWLEARWARG